MLAVRSIFTLDIPTINGTVGFSAALVVAVSPVVDVLSQWPDPRIGRGVGGIHGRERFHAPARNS